MPSEPLEMPSETLEMSLLLLEPPEILPEDSIREWEACMSLPLPSIDTMFPYLVSHASLVSPPTIDRPHLMFVNSSTFLSSCTSSYNNCVSFQDLLTPLEEIYTIDKQKLRSIVSDLLLCLNIKDSQISLVDTILSDIHLVGNYFPMFSSLTDEFDGTHQKVFARCFDAQINKFAKVSNFIVFCFSGNGSCPKHCNCNSVYRLLTIAQLCQAKLANSTPKDIIPQNSHIDPITSNYSKNENAIIPNKRNSRTISGPSDNDINHIAGYYDCVDDDYEDDLSMDFSSLLNILLKNSTFTQVLPNEFDYEEKLFEKEIYKIINRRSSSYLHSEYKSTILKSSDVDRHVKLLQSSLRYVPCIKDFKNAKEPYGPNSSDFEYISRVETMKISSCSFSCNFPYTGELLVDSGIWFGNAKDFSITTDDQKAKYDDALLSDILIESDITIPYYCLLQNSIIFNSEDSFISDHYFTVIQNIAYKKSPAVSYTNNHSIRFKVFIETKQGYTFPSFEKLNDIYDNVTNVSDTSLISVSNNSISLKFPASGTIGSLFSFSVESIMKILNLCRILQIMREKNKIDHINGRAKTFPCLIYCESGYVESSLLLFVFLIYSTGLSFLELLPEVHQNRMIAGRPFYLFDKDYLLLNQLFPILHCFGSFYCGYPLDNPKLAEMQRLLAKNTEKQHLSPSFEIHKNIISRILLGNFMEDSNTCSVISSSISITPAVVLIDYTNNTDNSNKNNNNNNNGNNNKNKQQIISEILSLPSRILPNLYLGLLENATSLKTLEILGINILISVGETVNWLRMLPKNHYEVNKKGNISVYKFNTNIKGSCTYTNRLFPVKYVLSIQNMKDDSIDYISLDMFREIFDFLDAHTNTDLHEIINSNGEKILVHCQAGVSRSATVVIAYLMKYLKMRLEAAFLFVKVRRLNIVIQPNIKLIYSLFKLQEYLILTDQNAPEKLRSIDWPIFCKRLEILKNSYSENIYNAPATDFG